MIEETMIITLLAAAVHWLLSVAILWVCCDSAREKLYSVTILGAFFFLGNMCFVVGYVIQAIS